MIVFIAPFLEKSIRTCSFARSQSCKTLTNKAIPDSHTKRKNAALAKMYPSEDVNKVAARIAREATEGE